MLQGPKSTTENDANELLALLEIQTDSECPNTCQSSHPDMGKASVSSLGLPDVSTSNMKRKNKS